MNAIVLVDNAMQPMLTGSLAILKSVVSSGYQRKLAVVFTHADEVTGPNLPDLPSKRAHVIRPAMAAVRGLREIVGAASVEALERDFDNRSFLVGWLNRTLTSKSKGVAKEMERLLAFCRDSVLPEIPSSAIPVYDATGLLFAAQPAYRQFQELWNARLGLSPDSNVSRRHWATIKALNRRVALGIDNREYLDLRPAAELLGRLSESIGRFLDAPVGWHGPADVEEREKSIQKVRQEAFGELYAFVERRLIAGPLPEWVEAFGLAGRYSTNGRARVLQQIVENAAPVPSEAMTREIAEFLKELRRLVHDAIRRAGGKISSVNDEVFTP